MTSPRIRETRSVTVGEYHLPDRTTDDIHILYENGDIRLRKRYEITRDSYGRDLSIAEAYNDFIKLILQYEVDGKTKES
jgi:hypothetical protein